MPLRITELMAREGLNAYRLAQALNGDMSEASVYRLASGAKVKLTAEEVDLLCGALNASPNELFGYKKRKG